MSRTALKIPARGFAALGDETRLSLVNKLSDGKSRSIAELTMGSQLTRQAMTKHLKRLERVGMVKSEREGRESRFRLEPSPIMALTGYLDHVSAEWDDALSRLKRFVDR